ncbi:PREDICTED: uncharacterized protein LOC109176343 isoform X2 [Ipomoea nil]|uniref:uncharacterized protein LOC109176343 isoform X2 n=1 Tax=Ipomoea nil TaxID=35883 RepID=UPI00090141DA|nr:PREDICTED: uncharacterized protein LOC109176343 isoform X2 [Ipomoea nil]
MEEAKTKEKVDQEIVSKLVAENLQLKALVSSLEKKNEEANKLNEERLKLIVEAESKMMESNTGMQRKEKLSDLETEKLLNSQPRRMSGRCSVASQVDQDKAKTQDRAKLQATLLHLQQATELLLKKAHKPKRSSLMMKLSSHLPCSYQAR